MFDLCRRAVWITPDKTIPLQLIPNPPIATSSNSSLPCISSVMVIMVRVQVLVVLIMFITTQFVTLSHQATATLSQNTALLASNTAWSSSSMFLSSSLSRVKDTISIIDSISIVIFFPSSPLWSRAEINSCFGNGRQEVLHRTFARPSSRRWIFLRGTGRGRVGGWLWGWWKSGGKSAHLSNSS